MLKVKSDLENNYQELIEILQNSNKLESDHVVNQISKFEKKFVKSNKQIKNEMSTLNGDKDMIMSKIHNINKGLQKVLNDKSSYKLSPMQPPLVLNHNLSFKPFPKELISNFLPSLQRYPGQYQLEMERPFLVGGGGWGFSHDGKYIYSFYHSHLKIGIHSLETLQLLKTFQCPKGSHALDAVSIKNKYFIIGKNSNKILILNDKGIVKEEICLKLEVSSLKTNGSSKLLIVCKDYQTLFAYDVGAKKLETIPTPNVQAVWQCCSMGGEKYCMLVKMNGAQKIIKCMQSIILKSYDIGVGHMDIFSNNVEWLYVLDSNRKVHILDGDLELVSSFRVFSNDDFRRISVDSNLNVYISMWNAEKKSTSIRKYVLNS